MSESCSRWTFLSDREALGETLSDGERTFLRTHQALCPACAAEQSVWRALGSLLETQPPVSTAEPVSRPGRDQSAPRVARRRRNVGLALACAVACAAAVALGIVQGFSTRREPAPVASARPRSPSEPAPHASTQAPRARVVSVTGEVEILDSDGRPVATGEDLRAGALLATRAGIACLEVEPGVRACLAPKGRLRVAELSAARRRLELLAGRLAAELAPQPAGSSFGVLTRAGSAVAVGTAFSVEVPAGDQPIVTRVTHGIVLVRSAGGRERRVTAQRMAVMDGKVSDMDGKVSDMDGKVSELSEAEATRDRELLQRALPGPEPRGEQAASERQAREHAASEPAPPSALPTHARASHDEQAVGARAAGERELRARSRPLPASGPREPRRAVGQAAAEPQQSAEPTASALLLEARERRARGDLSGTLQIYRALFDQHDDSREAQAARVAHGELLLATRRDPEGALAAFERYLALGGPLVEEARFGRVRALRALGRSADERSAIADFLQTFPDSPLAVSLRARARALGSKP